MALFNAEALKKDDARQEIIPFDFLELPPGEDVPELVIRISDKGRNAAKVADSRFRTVNMRTGKLVNDPQEYCKRVLKDAYVSDTLVDGGGIDEFFIVIDRYAKIAKKLAGLLSDIFEGVDVAIKKDEEEDEKN